MRRNEAIESQIKQYTDSFELQEIEIDRIDTKRSLHSQNRSAIKLDEDNWTAMALAELECGVTTPPIIVNRTKAGKYLVVDGNHRVKAKQEIGKSTIWAYVVEVDDDTYERLCIQGNAFNGRPLSVEERTQHALALIEMGEPATIVAPRWGFRDAETLNRKRRAINGRKKAASVGVRANLTESQAEILNRLEPDHIKLLGSEIEKARIPDLDAAQKAIAAAPSSQRHDEALRQAGRLEQIRQERNTPKSRAKPPMTQTQVRDALRKIVLAIKHRPAIGNDPDVLTLLSEINGMVRGGSAERAA